MFTPIEIRRARPDDAGTVHSMICALANDIGMGTRVGSSARDFADHGLRDGGLFQALIAERGGAESGAGADTEAVGLCLYFFSFSTWMGTPGVYVQDLWVHADHRGGELAERLLRETARRSALRGARYLRLSVDADNRRAAAFYLKAGLRHCPEEQIFMAKNEDFDRLCGVPR